MPFVITVTGRDRDLLSDLGHLVFALYFDHRSAVTSYSAELPYAARLVFQSLVKIGK